MNIANDSVGGVMCYNKKLKLEKIKSFLKEADEKVIAQALKEYLKKEKTNGN